MNRSRRLVLWVLGIVFFWGFFWGRETAYALVNPNLPGISGAAGPIGIIQAFYNFALMIGGLLAFIMILYAGIRYAASRGNPAGQTDAKDAITQALLGLLLLMGAYVILNTINPDLTNLRLPTLKALQAPTPAPPDGPPPGGCLGGACVPIQGFSCTNGCTAAAPMVEKLNCISRAGVSGVVTEGMPPSGAHDGSCHNNGCCVDFRVSGGDCAAVSAAVRAANSCGGSVNNEYPDCPGGHKSPNWTGPHLHINGC